MSILLPVGDNRSVSRSIAVAGFADIGDSKLCQDRLVRGMNK